MRRAFAIGIAVMALAAVAQNKPYITRIFDFRPAPGQFVDTVPAYHAGEPRDSVLARASRAICGREETDDWGDVTVNVKPGMISLGSFGGYVIFGFDHPVVNSHDYDFQIFGNSFQSAASSSRGGSSEPGIVMVSEDVNGNGVPDDPWYELAGSEYNDPKTQHGYEITYYRPDENKPRTPHPDDANIIDITYIRWTSNDVNPDSTAGYVYRNVYHAQSYWPQLEQGSSTLTFKGTKLKNNAEDQGRMSLGRWQQSWMQFYKDWGYVDNRPDYAYDGSEPQQGMNMGFKIDWAVDEEGNPVRLKKVDFIKVYCAMNQQCGWLGETSTEVCGGIDIHPDAVLAYDRGDVNGDGEVSVADITLLVNLLLGDTENPRSDVNLDDETSIADITSLVNLVIDQE